MGRDRCSDNNSLDGYAMLLCDILSALVCFRTSLLVAGVKLFSRMELKESSLNNNVGDNYCGEFVELLSTGAAAAGLRGAIGLMGTIPVI